MKIYQNKVLRLVIIAGMILIIAKGDLTSALAQNTTVGGNEGPVNLLGPSTFNNQNESDDSGEAVTTIDDALNLIAEDTVTDAIIDLKTQQPVSSMKQPVPTESAVVETEDTSNLGSGQATDQIKQGAATGETSITIGLREVEDVGLAAIGVRQAEEGAGNLNDLIWRGTSASRAIFLFENGSLAPHSQAIASLVLEVVSREAVPPEGANEVARSLVQARLGWLASAGRSDDLAFIVGRLPNDSDWLHWKKWLVEYQLMQRLDRDACAVVESQISTTLDPYWHKLKVICNSVQGDASSARFGADILAASGVDDPVFFALVDQMLNGIDAQAFDPALVEALHVVLMDAAHHEISLDSLATLPPQMAQGIVALRYLGTDARFVSTFNSLTRGLITPSEAGNLWRSATIAPELAASAVARHHSSSSPLTTAMTWRAIAEDTSAAKAPLIAQAMKTDIAAGSGQTMLPLYAELANEALTFSELNSVTSNDDESFAAVAMLIAMEAPESAVLDDLWALNKEVVATRALMQMLVTGEWNHFALADLDLWSLLPVIEALGIAPGNHEWLDFLDSSNNRIAHYQPLPPLLLRALNAAVKKRHVAEAVLLASWALGDIPLQDINPQDVAVIINAMNEIGQTKTGRLFAAEVVKTHILSRFAMMVPPMPTLSWSASQKQTLGVSGNGLVDLNGIVPDDAVTVRDETSEMTKFTDESSVFENVFDDSIQEE